MTAAYKHVRAQVRSLLHGEARMAPPEREPHSWTVRVDVGPTHLTIVKGGANTLVVLLGERRSRPMYPADALRLLDELARQGHPLYAVVRGGRGGPWYHRLGDALAATPRDGDRIFGVTGDVRECTHVARKSAAGALKWIARKA